MKREQRKQIKKFLQTNHAARTRQAMIWQDYNELVDGELFLANLTEEEFKKLQLLTKRLAGLGRNYHGGLHGRTQIYLQLWGDADCFGVFVQREELKKLRIKCEPKS